MGRRDKEERRWGRKEEERGKGEKIKGVRNKKEW